MVETRSQTTISDGDHSINSRLDQILRRQQTLESRVTDQSATITEQNATIAKTTADLLESIRLITNQRPNSPAPIQSKPANINEHGQNARFGNSMNYAGITRLAKLDFPRFNGARLKDWLFKVEQFFTIDRTPDDLKISIASIHLDDIAATWHQSLIQDESENMNLQDWNIYKLLLTERFDVVWDDSIAELKKLRETVGIVEYHSKFELIRTRVNLPEAVLVSHYLAGLRMDTQTNIRMFRPHSIRECLMVGRLYEQAHPEKLCNHGWSNPKNNNNAEGILPFRKTEKPKELPVKPQGTQTVVEMAHDTEAVSEIDSIQDIEIEPSGAEELILTKAIQDETDLESLKDKEEIEMIESIWAKQSVETKAPLMEDAFLQNQEGENSGNTFSPVEHGAFVLFSWMKEEDELSDFVMAKCQWEPGGITKMFWKLLICLGVHNMKFEAKIEVYFCEHRNSRRLITHNTVDCKELHEVSLLIMSHSLQTMDTPWNEVTWVKLKVEIPYNITKFVNYLSYGMKSYLIYILRIECALKRPRVAQFTVEQFEKPLITILSYGKLHSPRPPELQCRHVNMEGVKSSRWLLTPRAGHNTFVLERNFLVVVGFTNSQNLYDDLYMFDEEICVWLVTMEEGSYAKFSTTAAMEEIFYEVYHLQRPPELIEFVFSVFQGAEANFIFAYKP